MKRSEFLEKLEQALKKNGTKRVGDVLADYEEHFTMGLDAGKTEAEISQKLGDPESIAKAYETEDMILEIKNPESHFSFQAAFRVIGRLIILAPFNFLVLLIPGLILLMLLVAGWAVAIAVFASGLAVISVAFAASLVSLSYWVLLATGAGSLSLLGFSVLAGFLMFYVSKSFILASINYLQWNLKFILQK